MSGKRLAYVTCRIDPECREGVQSLADQLGVTVSTMTRSLLEREACRQGVSRDTRAGRLLSSAERFAVKATAAVSDGQVDAVERAELTAIAAAVLNDLWNSPEAA